jgi:hypothetical protein
MGSNMFDGNDAFLRLSEEQHPDSKSCRRKLMTGIVEAMIDVVAGGVDRDETQKRMSVTDLSEIISNMTDVAARADDATFSGIVKEAALLLCTLQHRHAAVAGHTTH